jgi:hypothetical protein
MNNIKNFNNYKTLQTYWCKSPQISNDESRDKIKVKESYGAFSLSAAVRYPWSSDPRSVVVPGVN